MIAYADYQEKQFVRGVPAFLLPIRTNLSKRRVWQKKAPSEKRGKGM
jgi:hypothetical protein